MDITSKAIEYLDEQAKELKDPALVVFERVYRGWCGTEVINTVVLADKEQIRDESAFEIKNVENCHYPVYVDKNLSRLWNRSTVDLTGWSAFKRLVLLEN